MRKRQHLRLIGSEDPVTVFDDLNKLQDEQRGRVPVRRARATQTFARIPHDAALALRPRLTHTAWVVLIELDRLLLRNRGRNPIKFSSARLRKIGIIGHKRQRALRRLERAGVISIERCGHGMSPYVMHLWYPRRD